jgi:hypothetical protein
MTPRRFLAALAVALAVSACPLEIRVTDVNGADGGNDGGADAGADAGGDGGFLAPACDGTSGILQFAREGVVFATPPPKVISVSAHPTSGAFATLENGTLYRRTVQDGGVDWRSMAVLEFASSGWSGQTYVAPEGRLLVAGPDNVWDCPGNCNLTQDFHAVTIDGGAFQTLCGREDSAYAIYERQGENTTTVPYRDGGWTEPVVSSQIVFRNCYVEADAGVWIGSQQSVFFLNTDGGVDYEAFPSNRIARVFRLDTGLYALTDTGIYRKNGGNWSQVTWNAPATLEGPYLFVASACPHEAFVLALWGDGTPRVVHYADGGWAEMGSGGLPKATFTSFSANHQNEYFISGDCDGGCIFRGTR